MAEATIPAPPEVEDGSSRIIVAVRCRPLSETERSNSAHDICRIMEQKLVILMDPGSASNDYLRADKSKEKRYAFDLAYGPEVGTRAVYDKTTKPLISAVMQAYNATVFAYGATGAGKTYSMIGTLQEPGVMLLTVGALFEHAKNHSEVSAVKCSFIEVYNENLRDLLRPDGKDTYLDLREDPAKGMCVHGVFETAAESLDEVMELLHRGNQQRSTEPTAMNVTSSRSHAVLQVTVEQGDTVSEAVLFGKLSLIDLAGSERASQTNNQGVRLLEGANINRSLLALGNCINALASGCSFVPFRDSKLTRLLKDSLGGNCHTVMLANISPSHFCYEDTLNTLKYANRAKNIRVSARQNIMKPETHVSQYQQLIEDLRGEVLLLKGQLAHRGDLSRLPSMVEVIDDSGDPELQTAAQEAGEHWKEDVVKNLEGRTQLQRLFVEVDRGLAQWYIEKDRACRTIAKWDEQASHISPARSRRGAWSQPLTLEEWHDYLQQIEESIRENLETRKSIEQRLKANKASGKELQAQLPQRVFNEDLRTFLELVQRVQVLEVERLELDHLRETRRSVLEERDQEIEDLREQLRLRNEHLATQRLLLSEEQQQRIPNHESLFGSTMREAPQAQQRGPMIVLHAWAPAPKDASEGITLDCRPLRERDSLKEPTDDARENLANPSPRVPVNWGKLEVPQASQLRGVAKIQSPLGSGPIVIGRSGASGWRESPGLQRHPLDKARKDVTGVEKLSPRPGATPSAKGGATTPSMLRAPPTERRNYVRRPSKEESEDFSRPQVTPTPATHQITDIAQAYGIAPPPRRTHGLGDKGRKRLRARSEHARHRMGRVGRIVVGPR